MINQHCRTDCNQTLTSWLCWQSEAKPSLPAKAGNTGRISQKAARAATDPYRKSQHLNTSDPPLPNLARRESAVHSREGTDIGSQVGDVRFRRKSRLPPPPDRCPLMSQSGHRPDSGAWGCGVMLAADMLARCSLEALVLTGLTLEELQAHSSSKPAPNSRPDHKKAMTV